ncbi:Hypothetical protein CINCED_3A013463 [Cinara cedri]|uniref:Uncharacterized protein n=1 Tax=Cinara cedri TaxID=506608 RepID=A0A5E4M545_9HEMI|nr:Hypothetical protein CINCED_3A013463 [Cinara cedri]
MAIDKYNWVLIVFGYCLATRLYQCHAHAALNGTLSRIDGGSKNDSSVDNNSEGHYNPFGPLVLCSFLPMEFIECEEPVNINGNKTRDETVTSGCYKYGGSYRYEDVEKAKVQCHVLPDIECYGSRHFTRDGFPCVKYVYELFNYSILILSFILQEKM